MVDVLRCTECGGPPDSLVHTDPGHRSFHEFEKPVGMVYEPPKGIPWGLIALLTGVAAGVVAAVMRG